MKIKEKYKGAVIRDPKIGRALEVNEKNLHTFLAYGYEYLVESTPLRKKPKADKKVKDEIKVRQKRNKHNSSNADGKTDADNS